MQMKKWMTGLAALMLLMTLSATALAGAGDQVDRLCTYCGATTTGTVVEVLSWNGSRHRFTFKCGTCQNTSECDEAHYGGGANCSYSGMCSLCGTNYRDWDNHNWSDWQPAEDGKQHYRTCSNNSYNPCIEYADHTVSDPQKLCTELQFCVDCNTDFYSDNHDWGDCKPTEDGKQHYYTCTHDSSHTMLADHASTPQATCVISQTCAACGTVYTDPTNHANVETTIYDVEPNDHYLTRFCTACNTTIFDGREHHVRQENLFMYIDRGADYHDKYYRCTICDSPMSYILPAEPHTYSEATCAEAPTCVCGRVGGEKDPDNHVFGAWIRLDDKQHTRTCENEDCGKTETDYHTGGEATTTEQAVCEVCHNPYGGLVPDITSPAEDTTVTVYVGERATIRITAKNAAAYQWYMSTDNGNSWSACGGDSPAYTTSPAKMENNGYQYMCVVTGSNELKGQADKEELPPEDELPPEGAQMSLRSRSRSTDDGLPDKGPSAESPIFTLEVIRRDAIPQTGDSSRLTGWLALLGACCVCLLCLNRRRG